MSVLVPDTKLDTCAYTDPIACCLHTAYHPWMPIGYVSSEEALVFAYASGDESIHTLLRGTKIKVDGLVDPVHGRSKVYYGPIEGWLESESITTSGLGLLAATRRSGATLPEPTLEPEAPVLRTDLQTPSSGPTPTAPLGPHVSVAERLERRREPPAIRARLILAILTWAFLILPLTWSLGWVAALVSPVSIWVLCPLFGLLGQLAESLARFLLRDDHMIPEAPGETRSARVPRWLGGRLLIEHLHRLLWRISGRGRLDRGGDRARSPEG